MEVNSRKKYSVLSSIFLLIYLLSLAYITMLSRTPSLDRIVRPIPFWSYFDWIRGNWNRGVSILLNIVVFVPLGYLISGLKLVTADEKKWRRGTLIVVLFLTISIEIAQYFFYLGYFDIDDIISNGFGGSIGILLYHKNRSWCWQKYIPCVMIAAGIVGCIITTTNKVVYETQFDFNIISITVANGKMMLDGTCTVYNREGLPYQVLIQGSAGMHTVETVRAQERFTGTVDNIDGELYIQFRGYQPIATSVYINNGKISYVPEDTPEPEVSNTNISFITENGVLKVYNDDYETYVYQVGDKLYWLIGKDFDASIIYHLSTDEPENLPENRQQYGFDNRGFRIGSEKELTKMMNCGRYRVFTDIIPDSYHVTAIAVGMNKGPEIYWKEYFRPNRF